MPRHLQLALAALIGLCLGAALAWLLAPPPQPRPRAAAPNIPLASTPAPPETAQEQTPVAAPTVELPDQPNTEPAFEIARGEGVITGVVKWEDGTPCTGLPLVAERYKTGLTPVGDWGKLSPRDRIARYEEASAWAEATSLHAVTDESGGFEFTGLLDGAVGILSNDRERTLSPPRKNAKPGDVLELTVRRLYPLRFAFTLDTGGVLTQAKVKLSGDEQASQVPTAWTPATEYRVGAGACKVTVTGGPHELWSADHDFEVPKEGLSGPVAVTLKAKDALIIRRVNEEPYYANPGVFVVPADSVPADTGVSFRDLARKFYNSGGGHFPNPYVVPDLAPGDYVVICALGRIEILKRQVVHYEGGQLEVELQMPPVRIEDNILVRVFGPEGEPIHEPYMWLRTTARSYSSYGVIHRGGGEVWVRRIPAEMLDGPGGTDGMTYTITVGTHFGHKVVECPIDQREPVEVRFGKLARLIVHLDNLPADRGGLTISASSPGGWDAFSSARWDQGGGPAILQSSQECRLASGPVTVAIEFVPPEGFSYNAMTVYRRELELREGDNEIRIDLGNLAHQQVRVPDTLKEVRLSLKGGGRSDSYDLQNGRVTFKFVAPGDYTLEGNSGVMPVALPATGEIVFAPLPYNAIVITRLDHTGVYEEIGLSVGDLVRAVNGEALSGATGDVYAKFNIADRDVTLSVHRDGRSVIVTATAAQWKKRAGQGALARRVAD